MPAGHEHEHDPHNVAAEYLIDVIDKILEAFHTGEGIMNNAPEPITLDIARRQIWHHIRNTLRTLARDGGEVAAFERTAWLRVAATGPLLEVRATLLAALDPAFQWNVRCYGPRAEGHPVVFYLTRWGEDNIRGFNDFLVKLGQLGFEVRDFTYTDAY